MHILRRNLQLSGLESRSAVPALNGVAADLSSRRVAAAERCQENLTRFWLALAIRGPESADAACGAARMR